MRKTLLLTTAMLAVVMSCDVNANTIADRMARIAAMRAARNSELQTQQQTMQVTQAPIGAVSLQDVESSLIPHEGNSTAVVQSSAFSGGEEISTREEEFNASDMLQEGIAETINDKSELVTELEKISSSISDDSEDENTSKLSVVYCG